MGEVTRYIKARSQFCFDFNFVREKETEFFYLWIFFDSSLSRFLAVYSVFSKLCLIQIRVTLDSSGYGIQNVLLPVVRLKLNLFE